jgi:hypothetical protein
MAVIFPCTRDWIEEIQLPLASSNLKDQIYTSNVNRKARKSRLLEHCFCQLLDVWTELALAGG